MLDSADILIVGCHDPVNLQKMEFELKKPWSNIGFTVIYLDHNATTPIAPEVLEAMMPYLTTEWGNPSSSYRFGSKLKSVIEKAREQTADLLGAHPLDIIFTSCGTESNNTAISAALEANPHKKHIITSQVEHSAILNHFKALETKGYTVTYLPVNRDGQLDLEIFQKVLIDDTAVVSLMWANNETGVIFPVKSIGEICRARGVLFHCDAAQAVGKIPIRLKDFPVDYLSFTGHKIHAPKGVGALYVRRRAPYSSYLFGGHQERGRRGGTESVHLIAGLEAAARISLKGVQGYENSVAPIRDLFEQELFNISNKLQVNGHRTIRLANTSNISFLGIESEALLLLLDQAGICASRGSACLADMEEPSHVIYAMTSDKDLSNQAIRFSFGKDSTYKEAKMCLQALGTAMRSLLK